MKKKAKTKVMKAVWKVEVKPKVTLADEMNEKAEIVMSIPDLMMVLTSVVTPLFKELSQLRQAVERMSKAEFVWTKVEQEKKRRGE